MGFSFRNLFNDNAGGMTGGAAQDDGPVPPANGAGDRNALPPQAAPGGGVSPIPTNGSMPFDPQPTGRGSFEEMFAAGNRAAMEASGAAPMPFGAAASAPSGPRARYTIGDLLQFVPPALATREAISPEQQVEVELPADGSRDVKLSTLYKCCPQLFATEITPLNDSRLTLPEVIGAAAPAAANPFGAPSIAHQPQPEGQPQMPVNSTAQGGVPSPAQGPAPASNPFDPNSGQNSDGAAAMPPAAGAPSQPASMSPMSWHQPEVEGAAEPPQVPPSQAPAQGGFPSSVGINPFDPNPASPPAQSVSGPVPISVDPIEVVPETSNISDANSFPSADDAFSGGVAEASDAMPSPFSLEEDNPFFLAEDDDDADFGAMAMHVADDAPSEPDSSDPSVFATPSSSDIPEMPAPAQQPFEPAQPTYEPVPVAPAQQSQPAQEQGSVFGQAQPAAEQPVMAPNPFAQSSVPQPPMPTQTPEPETETEPETAPVPTQPESLQAATPAESSWAVEVVPPNELEVGSADTPTESEPVESPFSADADADAADVASQSVSSFAASTMPNIEAPVAAASAQPFAEIAPPTESRAEAAVETESSALEVGSMEPSQLEAATPPPLPLSTDFAAAMPMTPPPVEEPELAPEPEVRQQVGPTEGVPASIRKNLFGAAANNVTQEPASVPAAEAGVPGPSETIKLPLLELLGGRSPESLGFSPQSLPEGAEAELPMSRIENQLSTGRVTVTLADLAAAAGLEHGAILAQGNQAVEIDIPQNLLFHHLPDASLAPEFDEEPVEPPAVAEPVNSLPPVQTDSGTAEDDAFAPAPADSTDGDLPPSGASVGFSTPFSSFAKDDEFLVGLPTKASEPSEPEKKSESVEDSVESSGKAESHKPAPASADWMKSIPGPLKSFGPTPIPTAASDMIEVEQPSSGLEETLLVEPPSKNSDSRDPLDESEVAEKPSIERAGMPLFGGAVADDEDTEAESADDFTIDSEVDDEVASFFTPSRPDSDEMGVSSKRAVADIDSLDTLPVLDEDEAEVDLSGGFFDELPPPAFSFEGDPPHSVDDKSEAIADEAEAKEEVEADEVADEVEVEIEIEESAIDESEIEEESLDEVISKAADSPQAGMITGRNADRIRDIELRAVFGTTEEFTLQRIADLTLELCSGIDSCDVLACGRTVSASRRCGAADGAEAVSRGKRAKAMYRNVRDLADNAGLTQAEELTLHTDTHAISFFTGGSACVTIHHELGDFRPGVREKLILVARGVAAFES